MNILIDLLPETVEIDSLEHRINTDFRIGMMFELLMQDNTLLEKEKLMLALDLYYDPIPDNLNEAVEKLLWFYRCGKEKEIKGNSNDDSDKNDNKKADDIYSFEYDDDYIYSAFLDQYRIDLQDIDNLHWWKFKAMFKGLKEDNKISKIMGYRSMTINNDMSDKDKEYYREMKRVYALPDDRTQEEKEIDFDDTLSGVI